MCNENWSPRTRGLTSLELFASHKVACIAQYSTVSRALNPKPPAVQLVQGYRAGHVGSVKWKRRIYGPCTVHKEWTMWVGSWDYGRIAKGLN